MLRPVSAIKPYFGCFFEVLGAPARDIYEKKVNLSFFTKDYSMSSSPHPPAAPTSSVEQVEPAWNPGGRNLSYINKTGGKKLGVIGILLCTLSSNLPQWRSHGYSGYANYSSRIGDVASVQIEMETRTY